MNPELSPIPVDDMNRLKGSSFFSTAEGQPDDELWSKITQVRNITDSKPHNTVFYPGAAGDFAFPLATVNPTGTIISYEWTDDKIKGFSEVYSQPRGGGEHRGNIRVLEDNPQGTFSPRQLFRRFLRR